VDPLIQRFNAAEIRYLLIGGQAVRLEGLPRFSMDWDFYVPPRDTENFEKLNRVLGDAIDLPVLPLGPQGQNTIQTYQTAWGILQFHLGGPGLPPFDEAERRSAIHQTEEGTPVKCLSGRDLLAGKKAAGRPQDQQDIDFLEQKQSLGLL
jgi:hypothetical protein